MRYALYHTPGPETLLAIAAASWLGRDAHCGRVRAQSGLDWLSPEDLVALTADPRRYGFHATLKAPFRLKDDVRLDDLAGEVERFAGQTAPVLLSAGLKVARLGPFFALVPKQEELELGAFAASCVRRFESFRAPLSESDLRRRRKAGLTALQDAHLRCWGYPYVLEEFRFHMTLTGRVPAKIHAQMLDELERRFGEFTSIPYRLDSVALFSQRDRDDAFRVEATFPLQGRTPMDK